jgi:hypothetical protein
MVAPRGQAERLRAHRKPARVRVRRLLLPLLATWIVIGASAGAADAQKPVNTLKPEVVGNPLIGERLVCGAGSWAGAVSEFSYRWVRDAIAVASGLTYIVSAADEGHSLWCVVTAIGSDGQAEAESGNSIAIPGGNTTIAPENVAPPEVSGRATAGETLSCSTGEWTGTPAPGFTYQWVRDQGLGGETAIESAIASSYKVGGEDEGHSLTCRVTATNSAGSASKLSNAVHVPGTKPKNLSPPAVLGIEPSALGESLTCSPGTWSTTPAPTFTFQWVRDRGLAGETVIAGQTSSTHTVSAADQLHSLSCKVIATNSVGSSEAVSSNSIKVPGSRPQNSLPPEILGTPAVGHTLTCESGTWTGVPVPTYSYLWVRDQGMPGEEAIGAANTSTYVARAEDRGHSLSCVVTAANSEGSASQSSERVVVPVGSGGSPPANELPPRVSGEAVLGATLACSPGTWSGTPTPTLSYQWLRDGSSIAFATAGTYVVVEADQGHTLSCRVGAVNSEGAASKTSADALEIPGLAPENVEPPEVTGTPALGETLTCLHGGWSGQPPPAFSYQWLRDGSSIASATASSYTVGEEDRGQSLSCRVYAKNSAGAAEATSSNSLEVHGNQPQNIVAPEVSGTLAVGNTLTCSPGTWSGQPPPTYTYQWLLNGVDIPSAIEPTYTIAPPDRGLTLACEVTASNHEGSGSATSKGAHVPGTRPIPVEAPQVLGAAAVGAQLTCQRGIWNGQPPPTFAYEWLRDGTTIVSASGSTYTVQLADEGHLLSCDVIATNSEGRTEMESSNALPIRGAAARAGSRTVPAFPPVARAARTLTAAQILAKLRTALARAQRAARISSLRRSGVYSFSFAAPIAGRLEVIWYDAAARSSHSAKSNPLVIAQSATSFARAGTETVRLRLTGAGRRLLADSRRVTLATKGVFTRPRVRPVSWLETVVLSR